MSIILNAVRKEGNVIYIKSKAQTGIIALTSFLDNENTISPDYYFTKHFRYSLNGVTFSDWIELTVQNIVSLTISETDILKIELRYEKSKNDNPALFVTSATIGTNEVASEDGFYFKNSIFYAHFHSNDIDVLNWVMNIVAKLFDKGLLPNYIGRFNDDDSPQDFIEFWTGISKLFAYYVMYARSFQNFFDDEVLLAEFIRQRGIQVSPLTVLSELQLICETYYKQVANRGSVKIVDSSSSVDAQGEFLRLIHHNSDIDEFIFNINMPEHAGWCVGKSSPMFRGMTIHSNANKWYEKEEEPQSISKYPVTGIGAVTIVTDINIGKRVLHLNNGGIAYNSNPLMKIKVDPLMDYELFFLIKKDDGDNLTVGFDAFDKNNNIIELQSLVDASDSSLFFENISLFRDDKYLEVRLFIYNKNKPLNENDVTLVKQGNNLRFKENVTHVVPKIIVNAGEANLYYVRFVPMITPYSKGFVQSSNIIDCWIKNNNKENTLQGILDYTRRFLLPADASLNLIDINFAGDFSG